MWFMGLYTLGKDVVRIFSLLEVILANIQELNAKADALVAATTDIAAAIDTEQAQVMEALAALQALVVNGGTEAERQAVADKLQAAHDGLAAARTDLSDTIPDVPPPPPPVEEPPVI